MLSRNLIRDHPERVGKLLNTRGIDGDPVGAWLELDQERRHSLTEVEGLKHERNIASKEIGKVKQAGGDASEAIARVGEVKKRIEELGQRLEESEARLSELAAWMPNLPHESVPVGADESANRVDRTVGEPPQFDFEPQAHWDLGPELGILDFERAAHITGARFTVYRGAGAQLERGLINMMLDLHAGHGYTEVIPPFIVHERSLFGTGQLPKFEEDLFHLEGHPFYLVPTAEVPLTNLHRDEILEEDQLPMRYTAHTPCFRAEAGSHGKDVRGLIRQHQFNKVELVQLTTPETSYAALEELTQHAERVLQLLELPYQVISLSTGDMGFSAAKTYDLEVWLPGQNTYREISSCSNCTDFQTRRAGVRYRRKSDQKVRYAHSLNGSGLAVGRTLLAVLENYQQADGSVLIPDALRPYMRGLERIVAVG